MPVGLLQGLTLGHQVASLLSLGAWLFQVLSVYLKILIISSDLYSVNGFSLLNLPMEFSISVTLCFLCRISVSFSLESAVPLFIVSCTYFHVWFSFLGLCGLVPSISLFKVSA